MRNTLFVLALCVAAILVGALLFFYNPKDLTGITDQSAQVVNAPIAATSVTYAVLESGEYAQEVTERTNVAARDAESFARLWKMAHGDTQLAFPAIDFTQEYVIGVFAGEKSSGGNMIEVTDVSDLGDTRTFSITLTAPGEGCLTSQAITSPYQFIRVPVSTHYLKAVDTTVTTSCE